MSLTLLLLFGVAPMVLLSIVKWKLRLTGWWLLVIGLLFVIACYYPLSKIINGPPMFYWQPPFMISNKIFYLLPPIVYFICATGSSLLQKRAKKLESAPKYQHSVVSKGELDQLQQRLEVLMNHDRVYIRQDLTMNALTVMLRSDRHTVSRLINERFGKNFFHFINSYRIRNFIELAGKDTNKDKSFQDLAFSVGFSNKTSFIKAFKRENKQTPSAYFRSGPATAS